MKRGEGEEEEKAEQPHALQGFGYAKQPATARDGAGHVCTCYNENFSHRRSARGRWTTTPSRRSRRDRPAGPTCPPCSRSRRRRTRTTWSAAHRARSPMDAPWRWRWSSRSCSRTMSRWRHPPPKPVRPPPTALAPVQPTCGNAGWPWMRTSSRLRTLAASQHSPVITPVNDSAAFPAVKPPPPPRGNHRYRVGGAAGCTDLRLPAHAPPRRPDATSDGWLLFPPATSTIGIAPAAAVHARRPKPGVSEQFGQVVGKRWEAGRPGVTPMRCESGQFSRMCDRGNASAAPAGRSRFRRACGQVQLVSYGVVRPGNSQAGAPNTGSSAVETAPLIRRCAKAPPGPWRITDTIYRHHNHRMAR